MPNRILKESICTSENIDQLSPWAEIAFYRLMVNCDDYGRMDARTRILKARLFPLKEFSESDIHGYLTEMSDADLISLYHVDGKPYLQMKTWERHQQVRAKRSKYPPADENRCKQMISNDIKCPRNPIQSESLSESLSESMIDEDDAKKIRTEQNRVLDAAEDAGFLMSNDVRAALIALYADNGLEKVLDGLKSCVEHGVTNLAYLKACLSGKPKKQAQRKTVSAQDYKQRDYSDEESREFENIIAGIKAAKNTEMKTG